MELVPNITGTGAVVAHNNREISYISLAEAAKSLNERGARPVQPSGQRSHREHGEATKEGPSGFRSRRKMADYKKMRAQWEQKAAIDGVVAPSARRSACARIIATITAEHRTAAQRRAASRRAATCRGRRF